MPSFLCDYPAAGGDYQTCPTARHCLASAVVVGHMLLVFGGKGPTLHSKLAVCERFHMTDDVWSSAASMIEPLLLPLVAVAANKDLYCPTRFLYFSLWPPDAAV